MIRGLIFIAGAMAAWWISRGVAAFASKDNGMSSIEKIMVSGVCLAPGAMVLIVCARM